MSTILKIGSTGYVNVDSQNYARELCATYYQTNANNIETLQLQLPSGYIAGQPCDSYLDGDNSNTPFASMAALRAWMDANFEPTILVTTRTATATITGDDATYQFTATVPNGYTSASVAISSGGITVDRGSSKNGYIFQNITVSGTTCTFDAVKVTSASGLAKLEATDILTLSIQLFK